MPKNGSSDYFRTCLAAAAEPNSPRGEVSRDGHSSFGTFEEEAVSSTTVVHASSSENTSYPLCRASRFAHVTACVENVTCEGCLLMLDGGTPKLWMPAGP